LKATLSDAVMQKEGKIWKRLEKSGCWKQLSIAEFCKETALSRTQRHVPCSALLPGCLGTLGTEAPFTRLTSLTPFALQSLP
jgi:hypothetical protein